MYPKGLILVVLNTSTTNADITRVECQMESSKFGDGINLLMIKLPKFKDGLDLHVKASILKIIFDISLNDHLLLNRYC